MKYTSVERIFSKLNRDLRDTEFNETDIIEWIGDALEQLNAQAIQEEAIAFLEVKDYHADIPAHFNMVIQLARDNHWKPDTKENDTCKDIIEKVSKECPECPPNPVVTDSCGRILNLDDLAFYRPKFDLSWEYDPLKRTNWYFQHFSPIRLAQHTLFRSLVCKDYERTAFSGNEDVYDIVGGQELRLRFSFKEGSVLMAYLRTAIDPDSGYPLIPDTGSHIEAITYYVKWKIAEWWMWNGREGSVGLADRMMQLWLKYAAQANSKAKMPQTLDDYQDLQDMARKRIPDYGKYNRYFGVIKNDFYYGSRRRKF